MHPWIPLPPDESFQGFITADGVWSEDEVEVFEELADEAEIKNLEDNWDESAYD
jgi:hypothetical protein